MGMGYYLGCPMWGNRSWVGTVIRPGTKTAAYLGDYAKALSTVEGNTTFYAVPKHETVLAWRDLTPPDFRFCFKFPKQISHELGLRHCDREVAEFLERMAPLGPRLGPFFLQLPPHFRDLQQLSVFLGKLPAEFSFAVEVRHLDFFAHGPVERDFEALLTHLGMDRVLFDTHRLMGLKSNQAGILNAQRKKPTVPVRFSALGPHPFLRYVGLPTIEKDRAGLEPWVERVATWMKAGKQPYIFMHQVPEDDDAPQLCRIFHSMLQQKLPQLPPLPVWLGEKAALEDEGVKRQLPLF